MLTHQDDGYAFLRRNDYRGALLMEPGLGKTRVGLKAAKDARRTLVVAPPNPAEFVWPAQQREWEPDIELRLVRGSPKQREKILFEDKPQVAVLNSTLLHWFYDCVAQRRRQPYELMLMDESNFAKNPESIAFRTLSALEPTFDGIVPMTGTPAENSLADIWGQFWFVDRGVALGKKIGVFRERFCSPVMRENYVSWKVSRPEELREAAAPLCFVRRTTDCIDMPALSVVDVRFELSSHERKIYDVVKKKVLPVGEPTPIPNIGVMLDKLRQVVSGFVYDDEEVTHRIGDSKAKALIECIDESYGRPLLIAFWYQGSKETIYRALRRKIPTIDRYTKRADKARYFAQWERGDLPLLLGQISTLAKGMNMQSPGAGVLFYDLPWSHGLYWQFIRRVWRQGQKTKVIVRRLLAARTVETYVAAVLKRKQVDESDFMEYVLDTENLI